MECTRIGRFESKVKQLKSAPVFDVGPVRLQWVMLLVACCLVCTSQSAILRPYRVAQNQRHEVVFEPTARRCCHVGERVAKKKEVCDITILAVFRKYERLKYSNHLSISTNKPRHRLSRLSEKVSKCSARYPKDFVSCCGRKRRRNFVRKKCRRKNKKYKGNCRKLFERFLGPKDVESRVVSFTKMSPLSPWTTN